jgi:exodeoxyribonuclease VIII
MIAVSERMNMTQTGNSMTTRIVPTVGIHYGVPAETYHQWEALSHSWMNKLAISPAHLLDAIENGGGDSTESMAVGSAVHCRVLEPTEYQNRYAARPDGQSGVTKEGKQFKADNDAKGIETLSTKDGRLVDAIAWRAKMNRRLQEWLGRDHATEVSMVWERDGYLCKARADLWVPGLCVITDLKTTITASPMGFATQVARYRYHEQAAWYMDGARRLTNQMWDFWFVACEKRRPYLVSMQQLARESAAHLLAVAECDRLFEMYKTCRATNRWPGFEDVNEIVLPAWASEPQTGEVEEESFDQ